MDTSFQSPVAMNAQNIDANMSYERRLASGILAETIKIFKGCTIQSTINNFVYYESDEQVDEINDSKEQVDARTWLINDSAEQVDQINDSDKHVYALSDSEKLVVARSKPKCDPSSNLKVATHTTNGKFKQKLLINPTIPFVIGPINPLVTADVVGVKDMLSLRQTVLPKANVTDGARSCARIFRTAGKANRTERDGTTPRDVNSAEKNSRLISQSPSFNSIYVSPVRFGDQEVISPSNPSITKRGRNVNPFDAPINGTLTINSPSTS